MTKQYPESSNLETNESFWGTPIGNLYEAKKAQLIRPLLKFDNTRAYDLGLVIKA